MKKITSYRFALALTMLALVPALVRAQWKNVAPDLVGQEGQRIGAIYFSHGVVWAGASLLSSSTDSGKTWKSSSSFPASDISDIAFYDDMNGIVGTFASGAFVTHDGGKTWSNVIGATGEPDCRVSFNGSASVMYDLNDGGTFSASTDGGVSWSTKIFESSCLTFAIGADKTIYVFLSGNTGWIQSSTDMGATWSGEGSGTDPDSQGLAADSCDLHKLYLINENTRDRINNVTNIDVSNDAGQTWQSSTSHPLDYYSGAIANTSQVIYIATDAGGNGVLRSTDQGASWQSIGGPMTNFDTRSIALANNNIVFVLDSNGSVWRTMNSGGDSLKLPTSTPGGTQLSFSTDRMQMTSSVCGPVDTGIDIFLQTCLPLSAELDSLWITGSSAFSQPCACPPTPLLLSGADSIPLRFWPSGSGGDTALLHLLLNFGGVSFDTTIELIGRSTVPTVQAPSMLHRETASAYFNQFDSLVLGVDVSPDINLDSLWPSVTNILGSYTWDSTVVGFSSYLPPSGWIVSSLKAHSNSVDFAIQNVSSSESTPLNLGTAIFQPDQDQLATSWVELSRLAIQAGDKNIGLCVADNEDNHWSVATLGLQSDVGRLPTVAPRVLSLYPNPASGAVWISCWRTSEPLQLQFTMSLVPNTA